MRNTYTNNNFDYQCGSLDIAYLLGIYLTDGYIHRGSSLRLAVVVLDKEICDRMALAATSLFQKSPMIRQVVKMYKEQEKLYWKIEICSNSLCEWLSQVTNGKTRIPDFVFSESREWKLEFLAGALDGDGFATFSTNRYKTKSGKSPTWYAQLGICGVRDNTYLNDVPRLLDQLGVKYYIGYTPPRKEGYLEQQRILIRPESFLLNELYFYVQRKKDKVSRFSEYLGTRSQTKRLPRMGEMI